MMAIEAIHVRGLRSDTETRQLREMQDVTSVLMERYPGRITNQTVMACINNE